MGDNTKRYSKMICEVNLTPINEEYTDYLKSKFSCSYSEIVNAALDIVRVKDLLAEPLSEIPRKKSRIEKQQKMRYLEGNDWTGRILKRAASKKQ